MAVVAEVFCDPGVDGGERELSLLAGLHGHADQSGIGVGGLQLCVGPVVGRIWGRIEGLQGAGGDGLAHAGWHPGGRRVSCRGARRGIGDLQEPVGSSCILGFSGVEGELLEPLEVGEAVI